MNVVMNVVMKEFLDSGDESYEAIKFSIVVMKVCATRSLIQTVRLWFIFLDQRKYYRHLFWTKFGRFSWTNLSKRNLPRNLYRTVVAILYALRVPDCSYRQIPDCEPMKNFQQVFSDSMEFDHLLSSYSEYPDSFFHKLFHSCVRKWSCKPETFSCVSCHISIRANSNSIANSTKHFEVFRPKRVEFRTIL